MSIACMNYVWKHSETAGADRLMLLALADSCNDDGEWSPGVARLAQKCNVSDRAAQYTLRRLVAMGEVEIQLKRGYKTKTGHTNKYVMKRYQELFLPDKEVKPTAPHGAKEVKPTAPHGAKEVKPTAPHGVQPTAPNTSVVTHRGSKTTGSSDDDLPPSSLLRSLIEGAGFIYLDKEFTEIATRLESKYATGQLVRAVESAKAAHQKKIEKGERGITAPLAYIAQILVDEPIKATGQTKQRFYIPPDQYSSEGRYVEI